MASAVVELAAQSAHDIGRVRPDPNAPTEPPDADESPPPAAEPAAVSWLPSFRDLAPSNMPPFRLARHLVSGSKRRTQTDSHDLDLTYITPRVIALGLPASGLERMYRNPLSEVRDFLDARHAGKYALVNLCDERDYSNEDWPGAARVFRFPFADHHPCCLGALHAFCERASAFLAADEEHVLAVHCKVRPRVHTPQQPSQEEKIFSRLLVPCVVRVGRRARGGRA